MRFSNFALALLPIAYASPLVARDDAPSSAAQLLSTINELTNNVKDLTSAVNNYEGSFITLLPQAFAVLIANNKVDSSTSKATDIIQKSSPFAANDSKEIVQTLASQITPIKASLDAIKQKYPAFQKTFLTPIVLNSLNQQQNGTDTLITALTAKVTPSDAGLLGLGKSILDNAFIEVVAIYNA